MDKVLPRKKSGLFEGKIWRYNAQQERKAALDRGRVDTTFQVGDQVMLRTKELLDAAEVGKLRPRWEGPFPVAPTHTR